MPASVAASDARSYNSFNSSVSGRSFFGKLVKYELKRRFYEKLDDFKNKVLLHREAGFVVYRSRCMYSGGVVILKGYARDTLTLQTRQRIFMEVQTLQQAQCPFILKCFDAFEDQGWWWLVLENCAAGDLYQAVQASGPIKEEGWLVSQVLLPILQTLAYLHVEGIIHRDIKPENVLFNSEKVAKLSGFFLSWDINRFTYPKDMVGTLDYVAPEVFLINSPEAKTAAQAHYDTKVDVWGVGILVYDMLVGRPPFNHDDPDASVDAILHKDPDYPDFLSDEAVDFIDQALQKDPNLRPTARQLLLHAWIQEHISWVAPEDFEDPIPDVDFSYYRNVDDAEDNIDNLSQDSDEQHAAKWYNPVSWFRRRNSLDDLLKDDTGRPAVRGPWNMAQSISNMANTIMRRKQQPEKQEQALALPSGNSSTGGLPGLSAGPQRANVAAYSGAARDGAGANVTIAAPHAVAKFLDVGGEPALPPHAEEDEDPNVDGTPPRSSFEKTPPAPSKHAEVFLSKGGGGGGSGKHSGVVTAAGETHVPPSGAIGTGSRSPLPTVPPLPLASLKAQQSGASFRVAPTVEITPEPHKQPWGQSSPGDKDAAEPGPRASSNLPRAASPSGALPGAVQAAGGSTSPPPTGGKRGSGTPPPGAPLQQQPLATEAAGGLAVGRPHGPGSPRPPSSASSSHPAALVAAPARLSDVGPAAPQAASPTPSPQQQGASASTPGRSSASPAPGVTRPASATRPAAAGSLALAPQAPSSGKASPAPHGSTSRSASPSVQTSAASPKVSAAPAGGDGSHVVVMPPAPVLAAEVAAAEAAGAAAAAQSISGGSGGSGKHSPTPPAAAVASGSEDIMKLTPRTVG